MNQPPEINSKILPQADLPGDDRQSAPEMTDGAPNTTSVKTGLGSTDVGEPEITPIRARSPSVRPRQSLRVPSMTGGEHSDADRGRLQVVKVSQSLSAKAAKKKRRKQNLAPAQAQAQPPLGVNILRRFTPVDSATEDSDQCKDSKRTASGPRPPPLAGASPGPRPASPGVSSLKLQLDALNLDSRPGSRSVSRIRSQLGSDTPSSDTSCLSEENDEGDSTTDTISYDIPIDQDFISPSVKERPAISRTASTLCADQRASSMITRKMTAADFTTLKCLGKGTYGTVHLVKQNATGRLYAQKQFRKAFLTVHKKLVEQTKTERSILETVNRHPFIVNLYYAFQDHERLYLILEYAQGGELFHHLEVEKFFSEDVAAFYMAEMILALDYLHNTVGVIYRDLKPENCLLDSEGHLLLTDFGLSKVAVEDPGTPGGSRCNSTGIGTVEYMAPEVIRGSDVSDTGPGYGKACDWWSFGALGFDLLTGSPPFGGNHTTKIQQNIMRAKLQLPYFLSPDAKDLLTRLMRKEPARRLGVKGKSDILTLKKHRFFRKIDWAGLERRDLEPPIRPVITDPEAAENFDRMFTSLAVSPAAAQVEREAPMGKGDGDLFGGFSFVASESLLEGGWLSGANGMGGQSDEIKFDALEDGFPPQVRAQVSGSALRPDEPWNHPER